MAGEVLMNFSSIRIVALASIFAVPALAQTAPCDPIGSLGGSVAKAQFSIERATAAVQAGNSAIRDLQDVIKALADNQTDHPLARNYILGEAYILMLTQPGIRIESPRSALGLTTNPTGIINIFASADSAFTVVETMAPACVGLINQWRQHKPWVNTLNAAFNALNAANLDSAEFYAKRALLIDHRAPYAYSVLGSVAAQRKDMATANDYWSKALTAAGSDTTYADVKQKIMFEIAVASSNAASSASAADKARLAREAIKNWQSYLAVSTEDYSMAETVDRLATLYKTAGDSASIPNIYGAMLANPGKYGENTLIHAGVAATKGGHPKDAVTLFDAARLINPYSRDALYNLSLAYFGTDQPEKMFPLVKQIVAMDPNNPDDQLLYAFAYQSLYKTNSKNAKLKRIYTDSLVYFNGLSENLPIKVAVTDFLRGDKETTLGGTIENRSATPKSYMLSVEFLDKTGAVVASQDVAVGPVAAKATQKFKLTVPKGGVYGFRYKPIS
jgi:tetratricopeptide (TPR) repeat protein